MDKDKGRRKGRLMRIGRVKGIVGEGDREEGKKGEEK